MSSKCAAFWHHVNIRNDNRVFPCCRFKFPIGEFTGDLSTVLDSSAYDDLRKKSNSGEPIAACQKCYHEEAQGRSVSLRQQFNAEYDTDAVELNYLEIGFDNICNLTCDACSEDYSSSWSKKLYPDAESRVHIHTTKKITKVPKSITRISFHGGEPLMTSRHTKLLATINNRSKVSIQYNTNGSFLLDDRSIELLKECKEVKFILSIDGYGQLNEQVRGGSSWQDTLNFIEQIKSLPFELIVHTTIHRNNWQGLPELEKFVRLQGLFWRNNIVTYPRHLDIATIEDPTEVIKVIKQINIPEQEFIINHIIWSPNSL